MEDWIIIIMDMVVDPLHKSFSIMREYHILFGLEAHASTRRDVGPFYPSHMRPHNAREDLLLKLQQLKNLNVNNFKEINSLHIQPYLSIGK